MPTDRCRNCGREIGAGGADGLDARCYQYQRRHDGELPEKPLQRRPFHPRSEREPAHDYPVRFWVPSELGRAVERAASKEETDPSEWWRRAGRERLKRKGK